MKFKTDFEGFKKAIQAVGKAAKKNPIDGNIALVELKAIDNKLSISVNGTIGITVAIPAEVAEEGVFVTSFYSLNMLSIRQCVGAVNAKSEGETLTLKYNNNKAYMKLTEVGLKFNEVAKASEDTSNVSLPLTMFKQMFNDTAFAVDDEVNNTTYALKIDISDNIDGILKFAITACDRKRIAIRSAYTVKNGSYTGSVLVAPDQLKTAFAAFNKAEGDVKIAISDGKFFMSDEGVNICLATLDKKFPDLKSILSSMKSSFTVKLPKAELMKALSCATYLQNEARADGLTPSTSVNFANGKVVVEYDVSTSYSEDIPAETVGEMPGTALFDAALLKEVVDKYPAEQVTIAGTSLKAPFWICYGENEEYIYCILPRVKK